MGRKVVNLTAHRNTRDRRKRHETRKLLVDCAKDLGADASFKGFFLVAWDEESFNYRVHDPDSIVGLNRLPDYVRGAAARCVTDKDND